MKYLPFENYTLVTSLSVEEARRRLDEQLDPARSFGFRSWKKNTTKPYEGNIQYDSFYINRAINYRNSFLPMITGHMLAAGNKTIIRIKMRPATVVLIFMCFWMGVVGLICILMIISLFIELSTRNGSGFSPVALIPFGMFLFGWCLCYFAFKTESKKSREFLANLFAGEEIEQNKVAFLFPPRQ